MIQRLEQALLRINEAVFQEFCNSLIDLKYNPNSISPIGSMTGKMKTKKGQPDCYFRLENGDLIFAEYTTLSALNGKNKLIKKLESDIKNCFKGITDAKNVSTVILCFTDNLMADELLHLNSICRSLSEKCKLEVLGIRDLANYAKKYPSLAADYLGISLSSQILSPKEFIKRHERFTFSTPLANKFMWRESELAGGLEHLTTANAIILSGESGIGKTKLALQIGHEFCQTHQDFEFVCVAGSGDTIFEEIRSVIQPDRKYLILVDDANRMSNNYLQLLNLLLETENGYVKVIATVRKYALLELKEKIAPFGVKILSMEHLSRQQLSEILTTQCKITNPKAVSRILDIAQQNARIALMCAKIEGNVLIHLKNPKDIFELCYSEILTLLKSGKDYKLALKSLAMISFCRRVRRGTQFDMIYSAFELEENQFWECCIELCEYEIVDLFDQKLVKISDQSLSTYLFREVFFNSRILDFQLILENFLDQKSLIVDSITPIIYSFGEEEFIEPFKKTTLIPFWESVKNDEKRGFMFLQIFHPLLPTQTIAFLSRFLSGNPTNFDNLEYSFEYTDKDFQFNRDQTLSILEEFRYIPQQLTVAIELTTLYGLQFPDKSAEVAYTLAHGYSIRYEDIEDEFQTQHVLVDFLIEKSKNSIYYQQLAIVILQGLISKTDMRSESGPGDLNGRLVSIRTYSILVTESYLRLRLKCLHFLSIMFLNNRVKLLGVIRDIVFEPSLTGIIQSDAEVLCNYLLSKLDPTNFQESKFANDFFRLIAKHDFTCSSVDKNKFDHSLHKLSQELFPKRNEHNTREYETLQREKFKNLCGTMEVKPIIDLIDDILLLRDYEDPQWLGKYNNSIEYILEALAIEDNHIRFIEICTTKTELLEELNCYNIFDKYFSHAGSWRKLYEILHSNKVELTHSFICFCQTVPNQLMEELNSSFNLYEDFKAVMRHTKKSLRLNLSHFLSKFSSVVSSSDMYLELCDIIIQRNINDSKRITLDEGFFKMAEPHIQSNFELYSKLYLINRENDAVFDYEGKILASFLNKDSNFLCIYFDFLVDHGGSWYMHEAEINNIWDNQKHYSIFRGLIIHIAKNNLVYKAKEFLVKLVRKQDCIEKTNACLEKLVEDFSSDAEIMSLVFKICPSQPNDFRHNLLGKFLLNNTNFSNFKVVDLLNKGILTMSSPGSQVSIRVNERLKIEKIRNLVVGLPNQIKYIEHLEYLENRLHSIDRDIERAKEEEFLWHSD